MGSYWGLLIYMKNIRIAFYTEAGYSRGMGHLVRSYTIAKKFKQLGFNVSFFLDSDINYDKQFDDLIHFKWESFKINNHYDIIFIDSYEANIEIYNTISKACTTPVYIDDFKRLDYPTGAILNFSPEANDTFYNNKIHKYNYLLGLKYIPIRDEFLDLKIDKKKQIFIMLGGADVANLSLQLIDLLNNINIKKVIVCNNKTAHQLQQYNNVELLYKPSDNDLIQAMGNSSLAISTASMTTYELAFLKIPALIIAVSRNQEIGMPQLIKHHIAKDFVSIKHDGWKNELNRKVKRLIDTKHDEMNNYIDGNGSNNIINAILELNNATI